MISGLFHRRIKMKDAIKDNFILWLLGVLGIIIVVVGFPIWFPIRIGNMVKENGERYRLMNE